MSKPNLIFIPGWNVRAEIFKPFIYELEEKFNCHLLTPPQSSNGIAYEQDLDYLLNYIKKNNLQDVQVLGWSMGGQLAILLAEKIKINKLYLLSTGAVFSRNQAEKKSFYELCRKDFLRAVKYFHNLMGKINIEDSILLKNNFINDQKSALDYLKSLHDYDLSENVKKIYCPAVIMHALEDKIFPYAEGEQLKVLIKNSQLISFSDDFHFPFFKHYAKITRTILEDQG